MITEETDAHYPNPKKYGAEGADKGGTTEEDEPPQLIMTIEPVPSVNKLVKGLWQTAEGATLIAK